ncbi:MAG: hypothetical protein K8I60_00350, partial [Anaerolineae bacterium]|nr:hypothetical protein [Anaerolineae bacterium]
GDYTVAWFLVDSGGNTVAQGMDSQPGGGFQPTSRWQSGIPVWDNRALRLPDALQPGTYNLWVRVYTSLPDGTLNVLPVTGGIVRDETIAVLPVTIQINPAP